MTNKRKESILRKLQCDHWIALVLPQNDKKQIEEKEYVDFANENGVNYFIFEKRSNRAVVFYHEGYDPETIRARVDALMY